MLDKPELFYEKFLQYNSHIFFQLGEVAPEASENFCQLHGDSSKNLQLKALICVLCDGSVFTDPRQGGRAKIGSDADQIVLYSLVANY